MTLTTADNTGRDSILQLLADIGTCRDDNPAPDCIPFDWRQSHYFTESQLATLKEALNEVGKVAASDLARLCGGAYTVDVSTVTQHYASALIDEYNALEKTTLFQGFGPSAEESLGVLALTTEEARACVAFLMGSSDSEEGQADAELSSFELSLLTDVVTTLLHAWAHLGDSFRYQRHKRDTCERLDVSWDRAGHLCRMTWNVTRQAAEDEEGQQTSVVFILPCASLDRLADKTVLRQEATPEAVSQAVTDHLQSYPVEVCAEMGRITLSFQAVMQLRVHDVIVLDRSVHEPIDILVAGQPVFQAIPGRSQGQQAVQITAVVSDDDPA